MTMPWFARLLLVRPSTVEAGLARVRASGLVPRVPNAWQITLGVVRMWHRVLFRSDTIGTSKRHPPRRTTRARLLEHRVVRFPFLLRERAIAPWDFSGFLSSRERILRHLLGAHHDGDQFLYDLEMLLLHPGALEELVSRTRQVVLGDSPRARWLRDLCVYDGYHEELLAAAEEALEGRSSTSTDPDVSFFAYLAWCAQQPATYEETLDAALGSLLVIAADFLAMPRKDLARALADGRPLAPEDIAGGDFRGVSLGLPHFVERLTWKTFKKSFRCADDGVEGWNVRLDQRTGATIRTFGPFRVVPSDHGVVLDYGARHPAWHPLARVRDRIVALDDAASLLLGVLYLEGGPFRIGTPSYFTLERE